MKFFFNKTVCLFFVILFSQTSFAQVTDSVFANQEVVVNIPDTTSVTSMELRQDEKGLYFETRENTDVAKINIDGESLFLNTQGGKAYFNRSFDHSGELLAIKNPDNISEFSLYHVATLKNGDKRVKKIPLWTSLIPPVLAILLALIFKEVVISLFIGIWSGAFIAGGMRIESLYYIVYSFFSVIHEYITGALNDSGHLAVIVFSILIGGMVAIISKNGGMAGVVKVLSKYAKDARSSQLTTWFMGIAIFFDDYANTLIVGNTMRSVTDKFKISREKLAYIVDSTAAPVSAIAFITTWIGAELGYIDDGMSKIALDSGMTAYAIFLASLKYSFYPILTLIFVLLLIHAQRDYGPMRQAEIRAYTTGKVSSAMTKDQDEPNMEDLSPVAGSPLKWQHAFFPVLTVILMTIFGLLDTGFDALYTEITETGSGFISHSWGSVWSNMGVLFAEGSASFFTKMGKVIGAADSYTALLWASASGVVLAIILTLAGRVMKLFDTMHWMVTGFKTMLPALLILTLAWALAQTTNELHTADFLSNAIQGSLNPAFLPVIVFILSAFIAFSTGSSWSTMAILYPIAIPTTYAVCQAAGVDPANTMELLLNVIATVLAASVLGDHCSPISDTTILSSLASDCNHIDHVRTQLPYALTVGGVSITCVGLSAILGGGLLLNFILFVAGIGLLWLIILKAGKKVRV